MTSYSQSFEPFSVVSSASDRQGNIACHRVYDTEGAVDLSNEMSGRLGRQVMAGSGVITFYGDERLKLATDLAYNFGSAVSSNRTRFAGFSAFTRYGETNANVSVVLTHDGADGGNLDQTQVDSRVAELGVELAQHLRNVNHMA